MVDTSQLTHESLFEAVKALLREHPDDWDAVFAAWDTLKAVYINEACAHCDEPFGEFVECLEFSLNSAQDELTPYEYLELTEEANDALRSRIFTTRVTVTSRPSGLVVVEIFTSPGGDDDEAESSEEIRH